MARSDYFDSTDKGIGESQPQIDRISESLDLLPEQPPIDIFHNGADEAKCIAGRFQMAWPLNGRKREAIVSISSQGENMQEQRYLFRVFFELSEEYLALLTLSPLDEFRLSLRGAEVQKLAQIPKISNLAMQLVFSKGVHIRWGRQGQERKALNTWLVNDSPQNGDDSWYLSPWTGLEGLSKPSEGKRKRDELEEPVQSPFSCSQLSTSSIRQGEIQEASRDKEIQKQVKKRRRLEAKRQKQDAAAKQKAEEDDQIPSTSDPTTSHNDNKHSGNGATGAGTSRSKSRSSIISGSSSAQEHSIRENHDADAALNSGQGSLEFQAGFRSGSSVYSAIRDVRLKQSVFLIGIVTSLSPPSRTRSGDWMRYVHIVDPSNCNTHSAGLEGFKINCFTKRHKEWLPHPEEGDVLILHNVRIVEYRGALTGTGYPDKLRWAAISPSNGAIHHGPPNNTPKEEGLAEGGFGAAFSPFLKPEAREISYCVKLSDWWREMRPKDSAKASAENDNRVARYSDSSFSGKRMHRLISEAGPLVPPQGYFDCTVEVLKGFHCNNSGMTYTLYVTDYTRNGEMKGVQSNWCPASLSEFVLQFEMWDAAAEIAQRMRPGQYYFIKNARMKINSSGYLEGKVSQDKIIRLEETDAATNGHLKTLLERKQKWQVKQASSESDIQYQLIQDIEEGKFFHCTVELLQTMDRRSCIYVTDYTEHPRLTTMTISEPWAQGLEGRIIKIHLTEEQQDVADSAIAGSFYCIRKLRLKYSPVEDCFYGMLGGNERLILALNPNKTDNEHLNGLLRRKEYWEKKMAQHEQSRSIAPIKKPPSNSALPSESLAQTIEQTACCTRIKDIPREDTGHRRFRILGRAVDFHPLELQDACYQFCSRCKAEIPKKQLACCKCQDFEHDYVQYMYQLYVMIEDEDQNQIIVSINDTCPLLDGLKRAYIHEDRQTLRGFSERVEPFLGNISMMHNGLKAGKNIELHTPSCIYEVDSWFLPEGTRAFSLHKYEKVI